MANNMKLDLYLLYNTVKRYPALWKIKEAEKKDNPTLKQTWYTVFQTMNSDFRNMRRSDMGKFANEACTIWYQIILKAVNAHKRNLVKDANRFENEPEEDSNDSLVNIPEYLLESVEAQVKEKIRAKNNNENAEDEAEPGPAAPNEDTTNERLADEFEKDPRPYLLSLARALDNIPRRRRLDATRDIIQILKRYQNDNAA